MQEIELEIKKFAPNKNTINVKILAKAISAVNEKIRHQGLSAKEILFSRDQYTEENLDICDEQIAEEKMNIRNKENIYNAKSNHAHQEIVTFRSMMAITPFQLVPLTEIMGRCLQILS